MKDLLVFCINAPLYYGIYDCNKLESTHCIEDKTSSALSQMYLHLKSQNLDIKNIYYACGPGNLSALKLTHIFLHTLALTQNINLFATDSFSLTDNAPIYAFGNKYFVKNNDKIEFVSLPKQSPKPFNFPKILDKSLFCLEKKPLYIIPAL